MNKRILKILIPVFVISTITTAFLGLANRQSFGAGCTIDVFWRWKDGKDYSEPPTNDSNTPYVGDTVKAVANFKDCNINNGKNAAYFILFSSGTQQRVGLSPITTVWVQHNTDFTFRTTGEHYFKAVVENTDNPAEKYEQISTRVNVQPKKTEDVCKVSLNFDANPKQVNSPSQSITLKTALSFTTICTSANLSAEFYHNTGKLIEKKDASFISGQKKEVSITTSASSLGYKTGDTVSFYVKVKGKARLDRPGLPSETRNIDITSSTVNVGVEKPPEEVKKYKCEDGNCLEDSNGPYSGLSVCQAVCKPAEAPPGVQAYACVAADGKYVCSPEKKSDCSDVPNNACQGRRCEPLSDARLCDQVPGAPVTVAPPTKYVFVLKNPIEAENFQDLVNIIGRWIFNLAIPIAVIIIIWAGILMLTSGGNPGRFQKGAKALWYAVLGLAVVLIGKGFVTLIQSILSLRNR